MSGQYTKVLDGHMPLPRSSLIHQTTDKESDHPNLDDVLRSSVVRPNTKTLSLCFIKNHWAPSELSICYTFSTSLLG